MGCGHGRRILSGHFTSAISHGGKCDTTDLERVTATSFLSPLLFQPLSFSDPSVCRVSIIFPVPLTLANRLSPISPTYQHICSATPSTTKQDLHHTGPSSPRLSPPPTLAPPRPTPAPSSQSHARSGHSPPQHRHPGANPPPRPPCSRRPQHLRRQPQRARPSADHSGRRTMPDPRLHLPTHRNRGHGRGESSDADNVHRPTRLLPGHHSQKPQSHRAPGIAGNE